MSDLYKALSLDEREAVADLIVHEGWGSLMKLIDGLATEQETKVLRLSTDDGADKLFYAKLKAEGARKLQLDIQQLKKFVKGQHSAPPKD